MCKLCRVVAFDVEGGRCIDGFQDWESAALPLFQHSGSHGGFQGLLFLAGQLAEVGNVSFCQGTLNDWVMLLILITRRVLSFRVSAGDGFRVAG